MKGYIDPKLLEPIIENIRIFDEENNVTHPLKAVLDTGFIGHLCVPIRFVKLCNLMQIGSQLCELADGSFIQEKIYGGK